MAPCNILYVDDEPDLLALGKVFLETIGDFAVDTQLSGEEALVTLRTQSYDAIISDYLMPGMDGLAFLKAVREEFGDIPFILFTGRGREAVVIEAINYGVDFYLQKGGDVKAQFAELAHKIRMAVERKRAVNERIASEKQLSTFFHASPIHQMITEYPSGRIVDINDRFLNDLKLSRPEVIGRIPDEIGLHMDPGQLSPLYRQLEKTGIVRNVPLTIGNPAGEKFTSLTSMTRVLVHGRDLIYTQSVDVTALDRARQTIDALLNAPPDVSMLLDPDGTILTVNQAALSRFSHTEQELIGRCSYDLISPELGDLRREKVHQAVASREPLVYTDDRTGRTFENHLYPVLNTAGAVTAVAVYSHDITERVRAKKALKESEEKYRLVVENSRDSIYVYRDNRFFFFNRQTEEISGYSREELMQREIWDFIHPDDREELRAASQERFAGGDVSSSFCARILRKNGEVREAEFFVDLVEFQGKPAIIGIARDITEKKRADEAIRERDEQLRSLADNLPNGMVYQVIDGPDGTWSFVHVSAGIECIHEVRAEEIISNSRVFYDQIRKEDLPLLRQTADQSRATLQPFNFETRIRTPSGREKWILLRSAPRRLADGSIIWDGIELDITSTKLAEDELKAAYELLTVSQEELRAQFDALKESEDLISESEEKYRTLVEHTGDGVFIAQDGKLLFVNKAYADIGGYTVDELTGSPFAPLVAPEDREMVMSRHMSRPADNFLPGTYEIGFIKKDGTRSRVRIRVGTGKYRGRPAGIGTIHDVTGEREKEAALAKSEELLRKMVDAIPDIIVRSDLEGRIIFINDKGMLLAGSSDPREIIGRSMFSFFAPECMALAEENTRKMFERSLGPVEYTFLTLEGARVTLEVNGDVLRTPEGTPYGLVFICRDVAERKEALVALHRSEGDFRSIIENMQDVFYRVDREGLITMISPYGASTVGLDTPSDLIGKYRATDFYANPDERDAFLSVLLREKKVSGYRLTLKDLHGRLRQVTASSRLIYDTSGNIAGVEGILHDITPIMEVKNSLLQANRQLTLMTSITRHDIHNQLMALSGWLELSRASVDDPGRMLDLITKEQQISEIIRQQIDFTTLFEDMGVRPPEWQEPAVLADRAHAALPFGPVRLDMTLAGIEIFADPLLEKVFYNLFDNSLHYGGEQMTCIRVSSRTGNNSLILVIEDNGEGIDNRDKKRLFFKGFGKNTGLGLFLVSEVLAITGLTICENGIRGKSARFEITVPPGKYRIKAPVRTGT